MDNEKIKELQELKEKTNDPKLKADIDKKIKQLGKTIHK